MFRCITIAALLLLASQGCAIALTKNRPINIMAVAIDASTNQPIDGATAELRLRRVSEIPKPLGTTNAVGSLNGETNEHWCTHHLFGIVTIRGDHYYMRRAEVIFNAKGYQPVTVKTRLNRANDKQSFKADVGAVVLTPQQ